MSEAVIHRVLGAVRFLDGTTGRPITSKLRLGASVPVDFRRNASGAYVIWRAAGLDAHTGHAPGMTDAKFEALLEAPPASPAPGSVKITASVEDPSGEHLPRRFELALPRSTTAPTGHTPDLFEPIDVVLHRSTAARLTGMGALLYAFVHDGRGAKGRLPGARVTVVVEGDEVGRATTGPSGEAVLEILGLPSFVTGSGGGAVTTPEIDATVRASVLPALLKDESGAWKLATLPDPDSADFDGATARKATESATLSVGRPASVSLSVSLT